MNLQQIRRDKTEDSDLVRSNLELIDDLAKQKNIALRLGQQYYPNDHHSSLTLQAQQDALKFIFDFYPMYIHGNQKRNPAFDVISHFENTIEMSQRKWATPSRLQVLNWSNLAMIF